MYVRIFMLAMQMKEKLKKYKLIVHSDRKFYKEANETNFRAIGQVLTKIFAKNRLQSRNFYGLLMVFRLYLA